MAETYEQYEKNKQRKTSVVKGGSSRTMEEMVDAAMDQTELLQGVVARLTAFVEAYEKDIVHDLRAAERVRERGHENRYRAHLGDLQTLKSIRDGESRANLLLDDLKVLLDQMPEGYKP